MSWRVGFCDRCGVLVHEWGVNIEYEDIGTKTVCYLNPCPVCKIKTVFIGVDQLSDI